MFARKTHLFRTTAMTVVALAMAAAAHGQENSSPSKEVKTPPSQPGTSDKAATISPNDTIVVTGSRLHTTAFTSPSPVQVVTNEQVELRGLADTAAALQQTSVAATSIQVNNTYTTFVVDGGNGVQTLSLRGLGPQRTLVLLNGRRGAPAGYGGSLQAFDFNVIPQSVIDRVEILTGGASSIYGSDAIAGVVNIITRKSTRGGTINIYTMQPFKQGGAQYRVSASYGVPFANGYLNAAVDYYRQEMLTVGDRDRIDCAADAVFVPGTNQRADLIDPRTGSPICLNGQWGIASVQGLTGQYQYDPNNLQGTYGSYASNPFSGQGWRHINIPGTPGSYALAQVDSPYFRTATAIADVRRLTGFVDGAIQLSPGVEAYTQWLFDRRETKTSGARGLQENLAATVPGNPFGRTATINYTIPNNPANTVKYVLGAAGLRGTIPSGGQFLSGWKWDVWGQYGVSKATYTQILGLADAQQYSDGNNANGECGVGGVTETPISHHACTTIAWFSDRLLSSPNTQFTPAELAFLTVNSVGHTTYKQFDSQASLAGDVFSLPAGPVGLALGVEFRHDSLADVPDPQAQATNAIGATGGITSGTETTKEAFGEIRLPLIHNTPLIEDLEFTGSARYTSVGNYGSKFTYKAGTNWTVTPWLRFRGTYGTSYRAPSLSQLFLSSSRLFITQAGIDPCVNYPSNPDPTVRANCAAAGVPASYNAVGLLAAAVFGGGSQQLRPETSRAFTIGGVLTPKALNLQLAIDYYNIRITNAIDRLFGLQVQLCYSAPDFPTNPYCADFVRDPTTHAITSVNDVYLNTAFQKTDGIDFNAHFNHQLPWGRLTLDGQLTRVFHKFYQRNTISAIRDDNGTLSNPKWTGNLTTRFDSGPWTVSWNMDIIGPQSNDALFASSTGTTPRTTGTVEFRRRVPMVPYHSFSIRRIFGPLTATAGIQNLFNRKPPIVSVNAGANGGGFRRGEALFQGYDILGRRAFLSLTAKF